MQKYSKIKDKYLLPEKKKFRAVFLKDEIKKTQKELNIILQDVREFFFFSQTGERENFRSSH